VKESLGMKRSSRQIGLFTLCVFAAFVQGWIILKSYAFGIWLLYVGIVGAIPFLILNGVHGDAEGLPGVVGGILYVFTNGAVYYAIVLLLLRLSRGRGERTRSNPSG